MTQEEYLNRDHSCEYRISEWLLKIGVIGFIVLYNILLIKSIKKSDNNEVFGNEENILPKKSQEILDKKEILTTTDLILKKYRSDNDNS